MLEINLKKIPTILGLMILLLGVGAGVYLVASNQSLDLFSQAGPTAVPRQVKVSNIGGDEVSISWVTDSAVKGFIKYGTSKNNLKNTVADDRDQVSGSESQFTTHYVSLRNLKPDQEYFYVVGSGSKTYQKEGEPYQFKTAPSLGSKPAAHTINGRIVVAGGEGAPGTIVYVQMRGGSLRSALSKESGRWTLPLATTRTKDLSQYLNYDRQNERLTITAQGGELGTATAQVYSGQASPVPDIKLGEAHNFLEEGQQVAQPTPTPTEAKDEEKVATESAGFKDLTDEELKESEEIEIVNPSQEGENVATSSPALQVKGPVGKKVKITVESEPQSTEGVIEEDGSFIWTPPEELEPGEHTVTIEYEDENGLLQTIKRSFTVLAAEDSDLPSVTATESATPTPTETPTPTPTATESARTTMPSTESGVPAPGMLTPTLGILMIGIILFITGIIWQIRLSKVKVIK